METIDRASNSEELNYLNLLDNIVKNGDERGDRTGIGTRSIFGTNLRFSLTNHFPILTTKKVYWKGVVEELLWFIRGDTNANKLSDKGVKIWDGNTTKEFLENRGLDYPPGFIGPGYGWQWRKWGAEYNISHSISTENGHKYTDVIPTGESYDQLQEAVDKIRNNPTDRRILVSAWNVAEVDKMALPPCHILFQFFVSNGKLSCQWYQRSVDSFLGLPFNISSYALLTCLIAKITNLEPGDLIFAGGDTHVYLNHLNQVQTQISREPFAFPTLNIPDIQSLEDIEDLEYSDIKLEGYESHPPIKAEMAV